MNKNEKRIIKINYLGKIPQGTPSTVKRYLDLIKNSEKIGRFVVLFKENPVGFFQKDKSGFYDFMFIKKFINIKNLMKGAK